MPTTAKRTDTETATGHGSLQPPKSRRHKQDLLAFAGIWHDLDADQLIEAIYRSRREAPTDSCSLR